MHEDEKFRCQVEGCEGPHCRKCGHHYDPACGQNGICDACQIERGRQEREARVKDFQGNTEELYKFMGW